MLATMYKLLVASCGSLLITSAFAATPIATVSVPLTNEQTEQVTPLLTVGLNQVMVRLTGNPQIAEQASIAELLKDPNVFLERYTQQDNPPRLSVAFDQGAIQQALNKVGIATWTDKRPTILVWWLTSQGDTNELMADSQANDNILKQAAASQGFPISLPIADLDEQGLTDKATFNAEKPTALFTASTKYNANAIVAINASQTTDNQWQLQWRLWQANSPELLAKGQLTATSLPEASQQLFAAINPPLAKIYVVKAGETKQLMVTIKDVDFASYVQVSKLMADFNARPLENSGSTVRYEVQADPAQLKAQLELINLFQQPSATDSSELIFKPQ